MRIPLIKTEDNRRGKLLSFFRYFGGKRQEARYYPFPRHRTIIEPFAGAAGYSTLHADRNVILYELNSIVYGVWDYLLHTTTEEILKLPDVVEHLDNHKDLCQEAKWLIGFWLKPAQTAPTPTKGCMFQEKSPTSCWCRKTKLRLAKQVNFIRHWKVYNKSYEESPNVEATWFIDPPYQVAGKSYKCKISDYQSLGEWCKTRKGQIMVCEQEGADWLPFRKFGKAQSANGKGRVGKSNEVIWTCNT